MSNKPEMQETMADIVAWLRKPQDGENGYLAAWRNEIADLIEAAWKREKNEIEAAALATGGYIEATRRGASLLSKPAGSDNNARAIITSGNNAAAMREALIKARSEICKFAKYQCDSLKWENSNIQANCGDVLCSWRGLCEAKTAINAALSAPSRNCDVGTAEEQGRRFDSFCDANKYVGDDGANWCSPKCPCYTIIDCGVAWAQMPYESEAPQ